MMLKLPILVCAMVVTVAAIIKLSWVLGLYALLLWILGIFVFPFDF